MDIKPLANRITLRAPKAPEKIGSIYVPPEAEQTYKLCQAEVVAVGPLVRDDRLRVGVSVITKRFGGFAHDDKREVFTVYEDAVLAIVDEGAL
jgi:co-chaperonin GroES (HSP10)